MAMSKKLTFSLASLVLLIGLIAMPVMAQVDYEGQAVLTRVTAMEARGFVVTAAAGGDIPDAVEVGLPNSAENNLQTLFRRGVTITLLAPNTLDIAGTALVPVPGEDLGEGDTATADVLKIKAKDVVISEIMWGLNEAAAFGVQRAEQFIEFYNTVVSDTSPDVDELQTTDVLISGWFLHWDTGRDSTYFGNSPGDPVKFTPANGTEGAYIIVDQVSNLKFGGWNPVADGLGQSGKIGATAGDLDNPVDIKSMYRNIGYAKGRGDIPDGSEKGSWKQSTEPYGTNLIGTPGGQHFQGLTIIGATELKYDSVIINEVGNNEDDEYDWVELRNVTEAAVVIKKWRLSTVTAVGKANDTELVTFPDDGHYTIPAKGVVLIVNSDPFGDDEHPIAAGTKWNKGEARVERPAAGSTYFVSDKLKLGDGDYMLVLRAGYDDANPHKNIKDLTGAKYISDEAFSTSVWPLKGTKKGHGNVFHADLTDEKFREGQVYHRNVATAGTAQNTWTRAGYNGIGYKRNVDNDLQNGGTPGFHGNLIAKSATLAENSISISEIMYETARNAPQWLELYNNSATQAVNLGAWKLMFENADDADVRSPVTTNDLPGIIIQPKQTVLVTSRSAVQVSNESHGGDDFPDTRIINLYSAQKAKLEVTDRNYKLLSTTSFRITLMQKGHTEAVPLIADTVGNMGDDGTAMWALPASADGDPRSSIIRRYDADVARDGTMPAWGGEGTIEAQEGLIGGAGNAGWVFASSSDRIDGRGTYYGRRDDVGTPGFRATGALPVSLSKFRPERMKDTGAVVVRWVTESELNNAGFNILRSETKDGEFTKLNTNLIAGQGTTSERTAYEYPDTSAKPNVVYYYQIQDVSLDGQVQTLRTTHLRGNVTAAGKLTTTWGELKLQD